METSLSSFGTLKLERYTCALFSFLCSQAWLTPNAQPLQHMRLVILDIAARKATADSKKTCSSHSSFHEGTVMGGHPKPESAARLCRPVQYLRDHQQARALPPKTPANCAGPCSTSQDTNRLSRPLQYPLGHQQAAYLHTSQPGAENE